MKWELEKGVRKIPKLNEIAKAWAKAGDFDPHKIVHWCAARFGRDSKVIKEAGSPDEMDTMAMDMAGIASESNEGKMVAYPYQEIAVKIAIEVMVAAGDMDWALFQSGEILIRNMLRETMSPLQDTDEDKRAQVLLKRADVHGKVEEIMKRQAAIMGKILGAESVDTDQFRGNKVGPESWATHATRREEVA